MSVVFIIRGIRLLPLLLALLILMPGEAWARKWEGFGPIYSRNQNPVYLQNLSLTPQRAEVLPEGVIETRIDSAYSNLFEKAQNARANVNLDMEYWRLAIRTEYGILPDLQIGIEIPLVNMWGGFLDAFIQDFHNFFGLPNGGRDQVPNNQFHYTFAAGGRQRFNFPSTRLGLGDIVLKVKGQLTGEDDDLPAIAWFSELKFPTGKQSRGWGSGAPDFGFGMAMDFNWKRLHGYFNWGYYALGGNSYFDEYMYNQMFAYMISGEISIIDSLSVVVQLGGSTPLLHGTGLDVWDGVPLDLVIGFKGEERDLLGEWGDLVWQVGFSEDVTSMGPSVDFTVYMSIGFRFDIYERRRPAGDWLAKKP